MFGLEISRLGQSNADLARLAEIARLTGKLLIDSDGVYDLGADPQQPGYLHRVDVSLEHLRGLQPQLLSAGPSLSPDFRDHEHAIAGKWPLTWPNGTRA